MFLNVVLQEEKILLQCIHCQELMFQFKLIDTINEAIKE